MLIPQYISIKNKYCLCYFGHNINYINNLIKLRPHIENAFPIELHLSSNDKLFYLLEKEKNVIKQSDLNKKNYAYVRMLKENFNENIILNFLKESDLCYLEKYL